MDRFQFVLCPSLPGPLKFNHLMSTDRPVGVRSHRIDRQRQIGGPGQSRPEGAAWMEKTRREGEELHVPRGRR